MLSFVVISSTMQFYPMKTAVFCETKIYCEAYSYTSENVMNLLVVYDETRHPKVSFKIFCVRKFQAGNIL